MSGLPAALGRIGARLGEEVEHEEAARRRFRTLVVILIVLALGLLSPPCAGRLHGQITVLDNETASLGLTGYVRSLSALYDAAFGADDWIGINAEVVRLKWQARWSERVVLDVHNRLQTQLTSTAGGDAVAGFGVSVVPERLVDLETDLIDDPGARLWHDVDRLALTLYTGVADVTVGRQAITWGISSLFPVADLWAQFSPFELDTEEKPGIDAVRVLMYPGEGLELDAVLADRGAWKDVSAGVRVTAGLDRADVWAGAGKFWNEALVMGGVTWLLDTSKLRAEAVLPWNLDGDTLELPRVTLGVDLLSARLIVSGEYHFNGLGAEDESGYVAQLLGPRYSRGESYYLGRHYLGGVVSWMLDNDERLRFALSGLANVGDGSVALTPVLQYDVGQATSVSLGALQSFGAAPSGVVVPVPESEFGSYGDLWFTRVSVYF